jgi:hypothetical protein
MVDINTDIFSRQIKKHWLNPATPEKLKRKNEKTAKGRILQGEAERAGLKSDEDVVDIIMQMRQEKE